MLVVRHRFPTHPASAAAARRAVDSLLAASSPRELQDARIVVSELVTAAIVSSSGNDSGWIELTLKLSRAHLKIEVAAAGATGEELSGHSLFIVKTLAEDFGSLPEGGVWALLTWERESSDQPGFASVPSRG